MYGEAGRGRGQGRGRGRGGGRGGGGDWKSEKSRLQMAQEEDALEATLGYAAFTEGEQRLGWLMNVCAVRPVTVSLLAARARVVVVVVVVVSTRPRPARARARSWHPPLAFQNFARERADAARGARLDRDRVVAIRAAFASRVARSRRARSTRAARPRARLIASSAPRRLRRL